MVKIIIYIFLTYFLNSQINVWRDINLYSNLYKKGVQEVKEIELQTALLSKYSDNGFKHYFELGFKSHIHLSNNLNIKFKHNVISDDNYFQLDSIPAVFYQYKEFQSLKSYTEEAYINYQFSFGEIRFGRFFDKIGYNYLDGLILGEHDYHDGYRIKIKYKSIEFSNRYFALSPYRINSEIKRHFHQHGLKWTINSNWTISVHETSIYAGRNLNPQFSFINPFTVYHANQMNDGADSNTNWAFILNYKKNRLNLWLELLIDDFQVDSEEESLENQEPNEIAVQIGGRYKYNKNNFFVDFTIVRNRTYNDPGSDFFKYTDHQQVIGFPYGNNLIQLNLIYQYRLNKNLLFSYHIRNINRGTEGLWSTFNRDYLLEKNYKEPIPYGNIKGYTEQKLLVNFYFKKGYFGEFLLLYDSEQKFVIGVKILKDFSL